MAQPRRCARGVRLDRGGPRCRQAFERPDDAPDSHRRLHHRAEGRDLRRHGEGRDAAARGRHPRAARDEPFLERARQRAVHRSSRAGQCEAAGPEKESPFQEDEEEEMKRAVGVIGLGIMGSAMAANLARAGFAVYGYDIVASRRAGTRCRSAGEVASKAPIVITSLPSTEALHEVSEELKGAIVVETSTLPIVANLLVAIHNVSAAEAFVLGMKAGLDARTIYRVAGDGAGTSRMFQVRGPQMVAGRYDDATMKNEVWQKDMKIIGEFATRLGVPTPLFNAP